MKSLSLSSKTHNIREKKLNKAYSCLKNNIYNEVVTDKNR